MSFVLWIIGGMAFKQSHDVTMAIGSLLIALNFIYNVRDPTRTRLTPVHAWSVVLHYHRRDVVHPAAPKVDRAFAYRLPDHEHHLRDHRPTHVVPDGLELGSKIRPVLGRRLPADSHLPCSATSRNQGSVVWRARSTVRAQDPSVALQEHQSGW